MEIERKYIAYNSSRTDAVTTSLLEVKVSCNDVELYLQNDDFQKNRVSYKKIK